MQILRKMARAIGTMGVVAGLVGAVTFANLTSNTVALTPNTLSTANAALAIGADTDACPEGNTTSTPGLNGKLIPGGAPVTKNFCLDNTGDVPLNITATIPDDLSGSSAAAKTTLTITCTNIGTVSGTLSGDFVTPKAFSTNPLATNTPVNCTASASLDQSFGSNNATIPSFTINFQGTQPSV
jgi:hypothetical protein